MALVARITFDQSTNEDLRCSFRIVDALGVPVDLTGADLQLRFRAARDYIDASTANGRISVASPTSGMIALVIVAADISVLPPGVYEHDLVMSRGGQKTRVWSGVLNLAKGIAP